MIDGVPTADELIGLSRRSGVEYARLDGRTNKIHITPEGHALLGEKLREASERNGRMTAERTRTMIDQGKADADAPQSRKKKK